MIMVIIVQLFVCLLLSYIKYTLLQEYWLQRWYLQRFIVVCDVVGALVWQHHVVVAASDGGGNLAALFFC